MTTSYDPAGEVTEVVESPTRTSYFVYDLDGNRTQVTDPTGRWTVTGYDADNRVTSVTDPNSHTVNTYYDNVGNVTRVVDALSHTTAYAYDAGNQATKVTDGAGRITTMTYDADGDVTQTITALGTTNYAYDHDGRQTQMVDYQGGTTQSKYDGVNQLSTLTRPDGLSETFQYDAVGRVVSQTDYFGDVTNNVFDAAGQQIATVNALGYRTTTVFDLDGRPVVSIDALGFRTTTAYDADSRQTALTDADGNLTLFYYDAVGNLTQQTEPNGHSATFAYDSLHEMIASTDTNGKLITFTYDGNGRERGETWYTGSAALSTMISNILTYTYDDAGNMTIAADNAGTYTMAYDAMNEMTLVKEPVGATLTMTYDGVGNRTEVLDGTGEEDSTYDALNRLTQRNYLVGGVSQAQFQEAYDAQNRATLVTRGTVASTTYYYDDLGRVTAEKDQVLGGATVINDYMNAYDAVGNLLSENRNGTTTHYSYDADNQLLGDGANTFTFDGTGNRGGSTITAGNEVTNDGVWTYTYDYAGNETSKSNATGTWTYTYDNRNELVEAEHHAAGTTTVDISGVYSYDAFGNMTKKVVLESGTTTTTQYVLDGWDPHLAGTIGNSKWNVLEDKTNGSLTTRYLWGDATTQLFAELAYSGSFAPHWVFTDSRNSVRELLDNSGSVIDSIDYSAYGVKTESSPGDMGRYGWDTYDYSAALDLYRANARWYDPHAGRWLSQDPLGFDAGDSNLYRYVNNRPTVQTDPSGFYEIDVHFYMTYYIASKIGFSQIPLKRYGYAYWIGWADQEVDEHKDTQPLTSNLTTLRKYHFVVPEGAEVTRNSPWAKGTVLDGIRIDNPLLVGIGLHGYQDSWSHEGFRVAKDVRGLGHADEGFGGHGPDYPWYMGSGKSSNGPQRALEMAAATYDLLRIYYCRKRL